MAAITTKEKNGNIAVGEEDKAWSHAMLLSTSAALPMVLNTVIELDVLEIIKRAGPSAQLSTPEIVAQLPTQNPQAVSTLDRLLRLLASHSVLTCSLRTLPDGRVERLYGLAPVCKFLTKDQDGHSLAPHSFFFHDKEVIPYWYHVKDAILEGGIPFNRMYGMPPYEYYPSNPRLSKVFNNAMVDMSTIVMKKILENYKGFEGISTLVDLGGNRGASLSMITSTYPNIKGINFDLPNVVDGAITEYPGVTHVGGDMFVSLPKADAIFIKSVFHNWDDEHCIKFMKNCYAALPDHGKVIACELYLPVIPETEDSARMAYHCDVFMWVSPNGKERTQPEYEALGKAAGFQGFRAASSAYDFKLMEFLKRN